MQEADTGRSSQAMSELYGACGQRRCSVTLIGFSSLARGTPSWDTVWQCCMHQARTPARPLQHTCRFKCRRQKSSEDTPEKRIIVACVCGVEVPCYRRICLFNVNTKVTYIEVQMEANGTFLASGQG
jgi:hypothetical protein